MAEFSKLFKTKLLWPGFGVFDLVFFRRLAPGAINQVLEEYISEDHRRLIAPLNGVKFIAIRRAIIKITFAIQRQGWHQGIEHLFFIIGVFQHFHVMIGNIQCDDQLGALAFIIVSGRFLVSRRIVPWKHMALAAKA